MTRGGDILLVRESARAAEALRLDLSQDFELTRVEGHLEALRRIEQRPPDLVLILTESGHLFASDLCRKIRAKCGDSCFLAIMVLATNAHSNDLAVILDAGADDCREMPCGDTELVARLRSNLRVKRLNDELRLRTEELTLANQKLEQLAITDELTGLFNMRHFNLKLREEFYRANQYRHALSVLMMDLDHFKHINDNCNHLMGSHVLSEVGHIIGNSIRMVDVASRFGGDEFILMLPETGHTGALTLGERIASQIRDSEFTLEGFSKKVTISIGVATHLPSETPLPDTTTLVRLADERLYRAKHLGRDRVIGQ